MDYRSGIEEQKSFEASMVHKMIKTCNQTENGYQGTSGERLCCLRAFLRPAPKEHSWPPDGGNGRLDSLVSKPDFFQPLFASVAHCKSSYNLAGHTISTV